MGGGYHPPPEVIESWPKPNYINPESKGNGLLIVALVFTVLSVLVVSLRLWTRLWLQRRPGMDDLLIGLAMVRN
jgi:hypothetical protein